MWRARALKIVTGFAFLMAWQGWADILSPVARSQSAALAATGAYDGNWYVVLSCPNAPGTEGALPYTYEFAAQVLGGHFRGEHNRPGVPGYLVLDGAIQPDGSAVLTAQGLTGQPPETLHRYQGGTPYSYQMTARFEGGRGTGSRTTGRTCTAAFTRR
jgi:hypothetical protein